MCPNLMTRFREEWYATRRYKALARRTESAKPDPERDERESRRFYFQKPLKVRQAVNAAHKKNQARLI